MTTTLVTLSCTNTARKTRALFLGVTALTLVACGGGGGGSGSTAMSGSPPPPDPGYSFKSLVADHAGTSATTTDPNLKNPWGIVFGGNNPVWTANNGTQTSTLYDGAGQMNALVVKLPSLAGGNNRTGGSFNPTGIVFNASSDEFMVSAAGNTGAASFIYSGEGGMIAGWSSNVDQNNAILAYTAADGAVYKGLALASNGTADWLYAADFVNSKVDVFDVTFAKQQSEAFPFTDPQLPAGYAPFGIQALQNGSGGSWQIYVAYAQQAGQGSIDNNNGAGLGLIDIFDANGRLVKRLVSTGGQLNAPWGLVLAPKDFGSLSNLLLVSNFGDGRINAFDPASGAFVASLADGTGAAFQVSGLWGIAFGNDAANQPHNTLFYAAGPNDENNGDYGRIDANASGTTPAPQPPGY